MSKTLNLLFLILLLSIIFLFHQTLNLPLHGDENEHLYCSYMIFNSNIPYRDFFEHHNPLLWYASSFLFFIFENSANIYIAIRLLMFLSTMGTSLYIYKISKILNLNKIHSFLSVIFYLNFYAVKQTSLLFRPDIPMIFLSISGFYYLLKFFKKNKPSYLSFSIFLFCLSFWFLQKSIVYCFPLFITILYLLYKNKIQIKTLTVCIIPSFLLSLLILSYFYINNSFTAFFTYNYLANYIFTNKINLISLLQQIFSFSVVIITVICIVLNILSSKKQNVLLNIFNLFFVSVFVLTIYPLHARSIHYFLCFIPFTSISLSYILSTILKTDKRKSLFILIYTFIQININYNIIKNSYYTLNDYININKFILTQTTSNDYVTTSTDITGLKKQSQGYYWFGPQDVIRDFHDILPYQNIISLEESIFLKKPKIIVIDNNYMSPNLLDFLEYNYQRIYRFNKLNKKIYLKI